ncbi:MAG: carboxypeptidase-like regulatory domain-containing protein, partial [Cyclobacteriaceae bacterium]|nr:carboxypeptidase-like regulatory domain-containing protein [Cyclobacteriaceae bacterium]
MSSLARISCAFLACISIECFGQDFEISGKVIDEKTNQPLPFANLHIEKTNIGTSTNSGGDFKLVVSSRYLSSLLLVSYIGYEIRKISLASFSSDQIIRLKAEARQLREVVIMPDSSLLVFLREAYSSIDKNYTKNPYEFEGFYRESLRTVNGRYLYFGEAQLLLQGSGYQFEGETGNVKIIKSRINHFSNGDTLRNALYYGGLFLGVTGDLVKQKSSVLKPDKRKYEYNLIDITKNEGKEVWIVGFKEKRGEESGKLFIEKESKAYLRTEVTLYNKDSLRNGLGSNVRHIKNTKRGFYRKSGTKWFLNYVDVQQLDVNKGLYLKTLVTAEFVVNKVKTDSVNLLPFDDRLGYTQVFSQIQDNFQEDFWKGTTVLVQDSTLQTQLEPYHTEKKRKELLEPAAEPASNTSAYAGKNKKRAPLVLLLTRLGFSIGTQLVPYAVGSSDLSLNYFSGSTALSFDRKLDGVGFPMLLNTELSIKLSRRWQIFYGFAADLTSNYAFSAVLG